jgi:dGTP triphosphohydrolase
MEVGLRRAALVCDYIAGMTDCYIMREYQRHFGLGNLAERIKVEDF